MVALIRFSTIVLVLFIMPDISPYRIIIPNYEPYFQELEPNALDKEYKNQNVKMDLESAIQETKYRLEKRNGDLINFLLGLPKDMLDAGR